MNIIIFGPPGAGKGTQSDKIASKYQLFKISTGDLLRNEIKKGTLLRKKNRRNCKFRNLSFRQYNKRFNRKSNF